MVDAGTTYRPTTDPVLDAAPSEPDHVVCCRRFLDGGPYISVCGRPFSLDKAIPFSDFICVDCQEGVLRSYRGMGLTEIDEDRPVCYLSGELCPVGGEADMVWRQVLGME